MKVKVYSESYKKEWDLFAKSAKNFHFFFQRDFLEYHHDRFQDFSLMIYDKKERLTALLPANLVKNSLYSHQGVTFGGFIVSEKMKLSVMVEILKAVKEFLTAHDINQLIYKSSPYIYHKRPYSEDIFALSMEKAKLFKRDLSEVLDIQKPLLFSNGRKYSVRKAKKFGFEINKSKDFEAFWKILEDTLKSVHDSKPVHSLKEIEYLHSLFPENIELFLVTKDKKIYAGGVTFVNQNTVKLQYVANYKAGRELGALDFMVDFLLKNVYFEKKWFDFGTSSNKEFDINFGLIDQKERFGASGVLNDTYIWSLT